MMSRLLFLAVFCLSAALTSCNVDPCQGDPGSVSNRLRIKLLSIVDSACILDSYQEIIAIDQNGDTIITNSNATLCELSLFYSKNRQNVILIKLDSLDVDTLIINSETFRYGECDEIGENFFMSYNTTDTLEGQEVSGSIPPKILTIYK